MTYINTREGEVFVFWVNSRNSPVSDDSSIGASTENRASYLVICHNDDDSAVSMKW